MEKLEIEQIENTLYSDEVRYAVRYGYQYRLEAEKQIEGDKCFQYRLSDASDFLYWLAEMVIAGIAYDIIKKCATALWHNLMQNKFKISKEVNSILVDENELKRFVKYVDEFNKNKMTISEKETKYIRGEIIADYVGEKVGEIFGKYKRFPDNYEMDRITQDAISHADTLLKGTK